MSNRRSELLRAAQEATAAYAGRQKQAAEARQSLAYGLGNIKQVETATYLESEARTRWLRASEAFTNFRG